MTIAAIQIRPEMTEKVRALWNSRNRKQLTHRTVNAAVVSVKYGLPPEGVARSLRVSDAALSQLLSIYDEVTNGASN